MPAPFNATLDYIGTVRGRIGYAFGRWMPYVTGGFAWGHSHVNLNDADGDVFAAPGQIHTGWTAGAGVEFAVSGNWSAKLEYDYVDLSRRTYDLGGFGLPRIDVDPKVHLVKLGLNYRFGDTPWAAAVSGSDRTALPESSDWNVHAQTTYLPSDLSLIPFALSRRPEPARPGANPGDLDHDRVPRRAALAGRRVLFQSGTGAGIWPQRHARPRRLSERRSAEGRRRGAEIACAALLHQADLRPRRRTGRRRRCRQSTRRQARHRPGHARRRAFRRRRLLRRQRLCQGSARRLHELGDVGVGRL